MDQEELYLPEERHAEVRRQIMELELDERGAEYPYSAKLAKARSLPYKTTEPFDEKNGSKDLLLPAKAMRLLFSLRTEAPDDPERSMLYAPAPLLGDSNIYVAGLQRRLPSQVQPLTAVRDQVLKDYREAKALDLAKEAGEQFAGAAHSWVSTGRAEMATRSRFRWSWRSSKRVSPVI